VHHTVAMPGARVWGTTFGGLAMLGACLTACGHGDPPAASGEAACVDIVTIQGEQWTSWHLTKPLQRETSGPPVIAERSDCNDFISGKPDDRAGITFPPLELVRIEGIRADQALFDPDSRKASYVYVRAGPDATLHSLPRRVRVLLRDG
jgi:hypothetical protein